MVELHTPRLTLRRPDRDDIPAILAVHSDARTTIHNPGDALADQAQAMDLFRRWDAHWTETRFGYFTVQVNATDAIIGFCGIKQVMFRGLATLNLLYRLDPRFWGHGYATEAASAVLAYAEANLPAWPLIARVRPQNAASHRVASKLGLRADPAMGDVGEDGYEDAYRPAGVQPE